MRAVVLILGGAGGGFQFLPDGIFTQRRRPNAKMGHLKRKADASTHIPPSPGPLWLLLLFKYLGQVQESQPIYEPPSPLCCSPRKHTPTMLIVPNPNTRIRSLSSPSSGATAGKGPPPAPFPVQILLPAGRAREAAVEKQLIIPDARETLTRYYSNLQP